MNCLHPDTSCQCSCSFVNIVINNNFRNTGMCTPHDFLSGKVRFKHTSTVTKSHSCSEKKYAYALRASCLCCPC